MNSKLFECAIGIHEYTIPDKRYPYILICKHCKKYGYYKDNVTGFKSWIEYDNKGNLIHYKNSYEYECQYKHDKDGNKIYYKTNRGYEEWFHNGEWVTKEPKNWKYKNECA